MAGILLLGSPFSVFNGGKSQGQSAAVGLSGDFPFLNFILNSSQGWFGADSFNNGSNIDPSWLASNGYPLASALIAHSPSTRVSLRLSLPALSSYTGGVGGNGNLRLVWTVTGAGGSDPVNWSFAVNPISVVSGSLSSTGNGTFSCAFTPVNFNQGPGYILNLTIPSGTAQVTNVALVYDGADYTSWLAGNVFSRAYLAKLTQAGFGVWRFMDWMTTNDSNVTTWATRKSVGYPVYGDDEYRASLSFGVVSTTASSATVNAAISSISKSGTTATVTTSVPHGITNGQNFIVNILNVNPGDYNVFFASAVSTGASTFTYQVSSGAAAYVSGGNFWAQIYDYAVTIPGTYSWTNTVQGNYTSGAPVDKMTAHVRFDQDAIWANSAVTITTATGRINWIAHPLNNGDPVALSADAGGNPGGTNALVNYYVVNKTANDFQIALTAGGSAVTLTSTGQNPAVTRQPTLNINGSGAVPIRSYLGTPMTNFNALPASTLRGTTQQLWGTVTYDAVLNSWMMAGGTNGKFSAGLMNNVPIEICFALCKQLGMHPHWSIPGLPLDPMTDYVTSLATYCKNNNPGWMKPHYEPGNEVWNSTSITLWGQSKGFIYWGLNNDPHNWYGKILSTTGQAIAAVYGLGNLGTTYEVMCGIKGSDLNPTAGGQDPRLTSAAWISAGSPAQSGYTISAASGWSTVVLPAIYNSPSMRGAPPEFTNAWQYFQVNGGTCFATPGTSAMQNLNNFVDTLGGASTPYNNAYLNARYVNQKSWGASFGVNKLFAYEGGYSPDLMDGPGASNDWNSPITGATKVSQCVLTLATTNGGDIATGINGVAGNVAAIGMCLYISGVASMTQLNTTTQFTGNPRAVFQIGSSTITLSNSFIVNQGIVFSLPPAGYGTFLLPDGILPNIPYFIVSRTSSTLQISATKGGAPITFTSSSPQSPTTLNAQWWNGWMVTNVSGNSVTIDCDSSAFSGAQSGGSASYAGSMQMCNAFRCATLAFASDLPAFLKANYDNFIAAGGAFPSQYQFSGAFGGSIWNCLTPDIYTTIPTQEFNMIQVYNGH